MKGLPNILGNLEDSISSIYIGTIPKPISPPYEILTDPVMNIFYSNSSMWANSFGLLQYSASFLASSTYQLLSSYSDLKSASCNSQKSDPFITGCSSRPGALLWVHDPSLPGWWWWGIFLLKKCCLRFSSTLRLVFYRVNLLNFFSHS